MLAKNRHRYRNRNIHIPTFCEFFNRQRSFREACGQLNFVDERTGFDYDYYYDYYDDYYDDYDDYDGDGDGDFRTTSEHLNIRTSPHPNTKKAGTS